jgi:ribosomal protein S18 acetylase RimI-like enzyme
MSIKMNVVPAGPSNVCVLASIHADACINAYKFLPAAFVERYYAPANQVNYFERILQHKNDKREILVGMNDSDKKIVGFIDVGSSDKDGVGKVFSLFLHPSFMRKGAGSYLLHRGEQWLMERGYNSAILWVFSENVIARKFYEKAGWEDTNVEEPTSWIGLDEVMCRKLQKSF